VELSRQENAPQQWASWAFSALSSKFYKSAPPPQPASGNNNPSATPGLQEKTTPPLKPNEPTSHSAALKLNNKPGQDNQRPGNDFDDDDYDKHDDSDFKLDDDDGGENLAPKATTTNDWNDDDDADEPWQSLDEVVPAPKAAAPKSSSRASAAPMKLSGANKIKVNFFVDCGIFMVISIDFSCSLKRIHGIWATGQIDRFLKLNCNFETRKISHQLIYNIFM